MINNNKDKNEWDYKFEIRNNLKLIITIKWSNKK